MIEQDEDPWTFCRLDSDPPPTRFRRKIDRDFGPTGPDLVAGKTVSSIGFWTSIWGALHVEDFGEGWSTGECEEEEDGEWSLMPEELVSPLSRGFFALWKGRAISLRPSTTVERRRRVGLLGLSFRSNSIARSLVPSNWLTGVEINLASGPSFPMKDSPCSAVMKESSLERRIFSIEGWRLICAGLSDSYPSEVELWSAVDIESSSTNSSSLQTKITGGWKQIN